jgi:hypothetical protein
MAEMSRAGDSLRVEVPDAASGFMLVQRLGKRCILDGSQTEGWTVAASANGDLTHVLATIQQWLHDESIDEVTVHLGERTHSMTRG